MFVLHEPPTHYWDEYNIRELIWLARQLRFDFPLTAGKQEEAKK